MHLCTSPLLPSSPLCGAQRAYKAPLLSVTAAYAASTAHGVAASQRHVPSQRKPTSLAALGTPLHDKQQRRNKTASVTTRLDSKAWLETLVVVEGLSDQCAVRKAVPAQVFVLHGASKSSVAATAQLLKTQADSCSRVIALLDPDVAGRQSRTVIDACLPGKCLHAFLPTWQATAAENIRSKLAGDVGVEHAGPLQIRQALIDARPSCPGRKEFARADLVTWGLLAEMGTDTSLQAGCVQRRAALSAALGLGNCDGKQLLRQLNIYGFSRQHVVTALASLNLSCAAALAIGTLSTAWQ
ncbi:hypothetical protein ABBQ32_003250 [Trebouxia sp. C0010 RCD-2024]